ncbi:MAG: HEAT repeat domain-containing protein [Bacteroidales bacterium]|nr:HEAT repeat domain-containing protein [Bacteroidales bacterium]
MECKNIQHTLIDFIERNISEDIKVQIEEHLLTCKTCRTEHKQLVLLLNDMNDIEDEKPAENLKLDFYSMLENEKLNIQSTPKTENLYIVKYSWKYIKYAATIIIILGIGFVLGQNFQLKNQNNSEIAYLKSELFTMQQTSTMASLMTPTASQRLNAINIIEKQVKSDEKTINTLINTFENDDNINVRIAAANALVKYSESENIRNSFIEILETEKDPALQITLINLLTQMQDERAKKTFKKILNNENTIPVVREQVQEGLKVFI